MTAIEKLKHLKYILDWNLNLNSMDILPTINEIIKELEELAIPKTIEELRNEYTEKFNKKPFGWWDRDVLISKLS